MKSIFGAAEQALQLTEGRSVLITNNLVNSSTPNFKARDIDFNKAMQEENSKYGLEMTDSNHIQVKNQISGAELKYRIPMQTSLDGNTVDDEIERKNFLENAIRYQVSLTFIQSKSDEIMKAIKGE